MGHRQASRTFVLRPVPPFRLDLTVWALRRRRRNLMDRWDGTTYRRVVVVGRRPTELAVRQAGSSAAPRLSVTATPAPRTVLDKRHVRVTLERLLGLRIDLTDWYHMAEDDERLRPLAERFRGMKPPRFPTMFEAVINALACQQLSLEVGLELLNRLAAIAGATFGTPQDSRYAFPTAPGGGAADTGTVSSDWVQPSKSPRTSRPGPRDHPRNNGSRRPRAGG
jgi:DNA-3-methyladenine glycosylase II